VGGAGQASDSTTAFASYSAIHARLLSTILDGRAYIEILRKAVSLLVPVCVTTFAGRLSELICHQRDADDEVRVEASNSLAELGDVLAKSEGGLLSEEANALRFCLA